MDKKFHSLKEKIKTLSHQIKEKDQIIKQYKQSLENSNTRIEKISQQIKKSFSLIQEINKNLIPVQLPSIPGFEISYKMMPTKTGVSGDFFDVIKIKDSMKFAVMLSTGSSYSLNSVFVSSFLKSIPNIQTKNHKSFLYKMIEKMNQSHEDKIHWFYAVVSRHSFEMEYYLTGDIFAGHYQKGGGFKSLSASPPLQKNQELKYKKEILKTGDILLLCSPGIKYRKNKSGEIFGEKRILSSVLEKAEEGVLGVRQKLLFDCNEFGKATGSMRDQSVLAIQNKNQLLKIEKNNS